jgi:hypothetical protein
MSPPMKRRKTLTEYQREEISQTVREVLGEEYTELELIQLSIREDAVEEVTDISCRVLFEKKKLTIKGSGKGPIDALFTALVKKFSPDYCSLENLYFARFSVEADIDKSFTYPKTDATVEATLEIDNELSSLLFRERASSISVVSAKVALSAIEHFINAEKCVVKLYNGLEHAVKRNRGDMINVYTQQMTEIVKNVSYEKLIKRLKNESKKNTAL